MANKGDTLMRRKKYVLTLGTGATRCQHTIQRATDALNNEDDDQLEINQIAIDTGDVNQADLPGDVTRLNLDTQGTARNRTDGREQLEKHIGKIYRLLKTEIHQDLRDNSDVSEALIIVMASLGGGSGSSMALPIGALSKEIARTIKNDDNCNVDVRVVGSMTIPRLQPDTHLGPIPHGRKHLNAHAALRELLAVQGLTDDTPAEELQLQSSPTGPTTSLNNIELKQNNNTPLYDALFLVPLDEQVVNPPVKRNEAQDQTEAVNWTLAHLVLALGLANIDDGIENLFESTGGALRESLYTADLADVQVPIRKAREYLEKKNARNHSAKKLGISPPNDHVDLTDMSEKTSLPPEELLKILQQGEVSDVQAQLNAETETKDNLSQELVEDLERLQQEVADDDEIKELIFERQFIRAVLACESPAGKVPEDLTTAPAPLSSLASDFRDWIEKINYHTIKFSDIQNKTQELLNKVPEADGPKDRQAVAKFALAKMAHAKLQSLRKNHSFDQEVNDKWSRWRDSALDIHPGVENASPETQYASGIRPAIEREIAEKQRQKEDLGVLHKLKKRKLSSQIEELKQTLNQLNKKYDEATTYNNLASEVKAKLLTPAEKELKHVRESLDSRISTLRKERRQSRLTIEEKETELTNHRKKLNSTETSQVERVPLTDSLQNATRETLEEAESIQDLLDKGILDKNDLATLLNDTLGELGQPLQGSQTNRQGARLLATITAQDNDQIHRLNPTNAQSVETTLETEFPARDDLSVGDVNRPFALGYLSISRGVHPDTIPEYNWVTRKRQQGRALNREFAGSILTAFSRYVAWPEVLDDITHQDMNSRTQTSDADAREKFTAVDQSQNGSIGGGETR